MSMLRVMERQMLDRMSSEPRDGMSASVILNLRRDLENEYGGKISTAERRAETAEEKARLACASEAEMRLAKDCLQYECESLKEQLKLALGRVKVLETKHEAYESENVGMHRQHNDTIASLRTQLMEEQGRTKQAELALANEKVFRDQAQKMFAEMRATKPAAPAKVQKMSEIKYSVEYDGLGRVVGIVSKPQE